MAYKKTKTSPIHTVLVISSGMLVIYLISNVKAFLYISILINFLGLLSNKASKWIDFLWMKLAELLSYIVPNILLSLFFYLFLFPVAIVSRLLKKEDELKLKKSTETMWRMDEDGKVLKSSFEKMW